MIRWHQYYFVDVDSGGITADACDRENCPDSGHCRISYEVLKLAGRSENPIINLLSRPGLAIQKLTTKEPDDSMIEVAIQAVEAVFDWRAYEEENFKTAEDL